MYILVDIGNTKINLYLCDINFYLIGSFKISTNNQRFSDEYFLILENFCRYNNIEIYEINNIIICSVVEEITFDFINMFKKYLNSEIFIIDYNKKLPINIKIDKIHELGNDIICTSSASFSSNNSSSIVIDCGTATTITYINNIGNLMGVSIMPGFKSFCSCYNMMSNQISFNFEYQKDMYKKTLATLGKNTKNSILSGTVYGFSGMIDNIIEKIIKDSNIVDYTINLTGGNADIYNINSKYCQKINMNKYLLLEGMKKIYKMN